MASRLRCLQQIPIDQLCKNDLGVHHVPTALNVVRGSEVNGVPVYIQLVGGVGHINTEQACAGDGGARGGGAVGEEVDGLGGIVLDVEGEIHQVVPPYIMRCVCGCIGGC